MREVPVIKDANNSKRDKIVFLDRCLIPMLFIFAHLCTIGQYASILIVAGELTGVVSAILLQQSLAFS
ncbi:MAG: hypothetical protein WAM14_20265 [Candidatus Nitrosopolaris sp.]